jgi:hypothetical protein
MSDREALCRIETTDAALGALDALRSEHGDLMLHLSGGAEDAGTPICLPAGELRLGHGDVFLGSAHGVDVYEQRSRPESHHRRGWTLVVDLVPGMPTGFSLLPGDGMRFTIRETAPSPHPA